MKYNQEPLKFGVAHAGAYFCGHKVQENTSSLISTPGGQGLFA
jgi:hypothetical protein